MARKIEVTLIDDTDGSAADRTARIGWEGVEYELDLSDKNYQKMEALVGKYLECARRVGRIGTTRPAASSAGQKPAGKPDRAQNTAIREWAKRKGIEVSDRGRIPRTIVDDFQASGGVASPHPKAEEPARPVSPVHEVTAARAKPVVRDAAPATTAGTTAGSKASKRPGVVFGRRTR